VSKTESVGNVGVAQTRCTGRRCAYRMRNLELGQLTFVLVVECHDLLPEQRLETDGAQLGVVG
jgi:hypothetical protein